MSGRRPIRPIRAIAACHDVRMRAPGPDTPVRVASIVARSKLFETLSTGLAGGITLVSAPAGSGKTVLLRSWVDAAGLRNRTAWVSVERDGRDPQRFWLAVVAALRAAAGAQGTIEDLAPAPDFDGEAVVGRITTGAASLDQPVLLVIDDLHQLVEPSALAQLGLFLARRPAQLRVILATRHDPAIGLHRYRLAGELTEIRAADLEIRARRDPGATRRGRDHPLGRRGRVAAVTHGGMGGGTSAGRALDGGACGPRAVRHRLLGQRADRGGLPVRRGPGTPGRDRCAGSC